MVMGSWFWGLGLRVRVEGVRWVRVCMGCRAT